MPNKDTSLSLSDEAIKGHQNLLSAVFQSSWISMKALN